MKRYQRGMTRKGHYYQYLWTREKIWDGWKSTSTSPLISSGPQFAKREFKNCRHFFGPPRSDVGSLCLLLRSVQEGANALGSSAVLTPSYLGRSLKPQAIRERWSRNASGWDLVLPTPNAEISEDMMAVLG
jgi:hypothetical protein